MTCCGRPLSARAAARPLTGCTTWRRSSRCCRRPGWSTETVDGVGVLSGLAGAAGRTLGGADDLDALEDALGAHPVGRDLAVDLHAIAAPLPAHRPADPAVG